MRIKSGFLLLVLGMPLLTETAPCAQTVTVFGNLVPNTPVDPDASAVTLGMKFWSTQSGTVSGIRFYRGAKNSNGYTVKLFTAGGSLLASARASTDTCAVPLGTGEFRFAGVARRQHRYIAAYYTSNGRYAGD